MKHYFVKPTLSVARWHISTISHHGGPHQSPQTTIHARYIPLQQHHFSQPLSKLLQNLLLEWRFRIALKHFHFLQESPKNENNFLSTQSHHYGQGNTQLAQLVLPRKGRTSGLYHRPYIDNRPSRTHLCPVSQACFSTVVDECDWLRNDCFNDELPILSLTFFPPVRF